MRWCLCSIALCAGLVAVCSAASAEIQTIVVTAGVLPGTGIDRDKLATFVETLSSRDLSDAANKGLANSLDTAAGGVSLANAQDNPFQPNLFLRGFEASPLAGDGQGLAVYVNGIRFNQAFGDTLDWDLIPASAIDRATIEGSNPIFGLNALGGSLSLQLKTGFTFHGAELDAFGGSFGQAQGSFEYGGEAKDRALYLSVNASTEDGWREHSPSRLGQFFADFAAKNERGEIHLDVLGADTDLTGNGPAPIELLNADRSAVFTYPDNTRNRFAETILYGTLHLSDALSVAANAYVNKLRQRTLNGDASDAAPCDADPTVLCLDEGEVLTDRNGAPIADFLSGGPYGQLNTTSTSTLGYGMALQADWHGAIAGHGNALVAGGAVDRGDTDFAADSEVGALTPDRGFGGPGIVIDQSDGAIAPVSVTTRNTYTGIYVFDAFDVTSSFGISASARYNLAMIDLRDRIGNALNGSHRFSSFNPAIGATYRVVPSVQIYGGYAQNSRAPTPAELSCADPSQSCSLTNFFVSDPPLKQVIAQTEELGLRGSRSFGGHRVLSWHAGVYRTDADDDIIFVSTPIIGRGYFQNVAATRRQGAQVSADFTSTRWSISADYDFTNATYRADVLLSSPDNPEADANGQIHVTPGAHIPSIPAHSAKAKVAYAISEAWTVEVDGRAASGAYLRGDEANLTPKTGGYAVLGLSSSSRLAKGLELVVALDNIFDKHYASFGAFSPTEDVPMAEAPGATNARSLSPAPPRTFRAGLRVTF